MNDEDYNDSTDRNEDLEGKLTYVCTNPNFLRYGPGIFECHGTPARKDYSCDGCEYYKKIEE